jgi:hypothetical protein
MMPPAGNSWAHPQLSWQVSILVRYKFRWPAVPRIRASRFRIRVIR